MQLTFNKLSDNKWYIDLPEWEGDFADLEMVAGADDLLEILSQKLHRKSITFDIWTSKPDVPCASMTLIDNDCEGATYQVNNFMFYKGTAWLCNVARFVFGGIHPRYIFFKVANNAPKKEITTAKDWVEQFNEAAEDRRTTGSNLDDMEKKNYDLDRFLNAQEYAYPIALAEMENGRKMGHWIWYIFPQQKGLGHSYNSEYYGLDGLDEARAYLKHPVLGERLREICQALLYNRHRSIRYIMGSNIDVLKLRTSMNLFDLVSPNDIFRKVLDAFF